MPIVLHNGYTGQKDNPFTWQTLLSLRERGFSVMKTPHVGNQHPSNLFCAAVGIHMDMVTFTQGVRDTYFHPHTKIQGGVRSTLYSAETYTPFGVTPCGQTAEEYHQRSVKERFPGTLVTTDMQLLDQDSDMSVRICEAASLTIDSIWYRSVSAAGVVSKCVQPKWDVIRNDIYRLTNPVSGYVLPNRVHMIATFIWQVLATGRDSVYHLSGPDMIGYIGKIQSSLSQIYDAARALIPGLPEVLSVYIVPASQSRLLTHKDRQHSLDAVLDVIAWYEAQDSSAKQRAMQEIVEAGVRYPEFGRSITYGDFMSQYDVSSALDLYIPEQVLTMPLARMQRFAQLLAQGAEKNVLAA